MTNTQNPAPTATDSIGDRRVQDVSPAASVVKERGIFKRGEWRPMSAEARRGQIVFVKTRGGHTFRASWGSDAYETEQGSCGGWAAEHEHEAPPCWSEGVCWAENAEGVPSDQPIAWRPAP